MNPITKIFGSLLTAIDRAISSMDDSVATSIRGAFFFLVFVLAGVCVFIGIRMGRDSAQIKRQPIISTTNDVFSIDINREKPEGNFQSMLDTEMVQELRSADTKKITVPSRENLTPDVDRGLIEPAADKKKRVSADVQYQDFISEGQYRPRDRASADVKPLGARQGPREDQRDARDIRDADRTDSGKSLSKEDLSVEPLADRKTAPREERRDGEKKESRIIRSKSKEPAPVFRNSGIVE